jgi:hypothetical protein
MFTESLPSNGSMRHNIIIIIIIIIIVICVLVLTYLTDALFVIMNAKYMGATVVTFIFI